MLSFRVRPLAVLMSYHGRGKDSRNITSLAVAVQSLSNSTLRSLLQRAAQIVERLASMPCWIDRHLVAHSVR